MSNGEPRMLAVPKQQVEHGSARRSDPANPSESAVALAAVVGPNVLEAVIVGYVLFAAAPTETYALVGCRSTGAALGRHSSSITVTGPSLAICTNISARKRPVATVAPSDRSRATTASTSGSANPGGAAALQLGRRPPLVSP